MADLYSLFFFFFFFGAIFWGVSIERNSRIFKKLKDFGGGVEIVRFNTSLRT